MKLRLRELLLAVLSATLCLSSLEAQAETTLPSIIGSNMVLQRDREVPIWGWDAPGTEVTVAMGSIKQAAKADENGRWQVNLPAQKAGGPHKILVKGTSEVALENVLFGEVWLCSGQSNMEWTVNASDNPQEEIANAKYPEIRHIKIPHRPSDKPESNVPSDGWKEASPQTVANFTAVGYFFARHLHKELGVPIGLIGSNWGGTRIEPWTPPVGFKQVEALKEIANNLDKFPSKNEQGQINHQTPLALYNGMIHPLLPYAIKGAIWYQGESNNGEGMLYYEKMKALIQGWREVWNNPEMPFYFVQLAPYTYGGDPARLAEIWEAQLKSLDIPHTGMAVTVDIGNLKDIHPRNKQDVGKRLALWALAHDYGKKNTVYSGPLVKGVDFEEGKATVSFDHVGSGLVSRDEKPLSFWELAGKDGKFHEAKAEIDGDKVVVTAEGVEEATAVRFGWTQLAEPNLSNKEGLPASPFRKMKE